MPRAVNTFVQVAAVNKRNDAGPKSGPAITAGAEGDVLICCSVEPVARMNRRPAPTLQHLLGHDRADNGVEMDGDRLKMGTWTHAANRLYNLKK
jgi:hypothetical protein